MSNKINRLKNDIIDFLIFIYKSVKTDIYTQYSCYTKAKLLKKSGPELQVIYQLLVSDLESRYMFVWSAVSLGAILGFIVGIGSNLAIEVLKDVASDNIVYAYNQFIIMLVKILLVTSIVGFILTMLLSISKFKSIGFYVVLFISLTGGVYWSHFEHSILMDLFFLILSCICICTMFATVFDTIKKCVVIKKIVIEEILANRTMTIRLPKYIQK